MKLYLLLPCLCAAAGLATQFRLMGDVLNEQCTDDAQHSAQEHKKKLIHITEFLLGVLLGSTVTIFFILRYTLNASITRMEIIAWTIRAMGGERLAEREQETISFPDSAERTPEEKGYLAVSSDSGLIVGFPDGNAHPDNACTRGEAFAILCRYDAAKSYVEQALEAEPVYIPSVPVPTPPQPVIPEGEPITITAPEKVTATDPWEVSVTLRSDVTDVQWAMPNTGYEGTLDTQGGTLTFSNAGDYTLTLSGKDAKGDPVSRSVTVKVKELPPVRILAPATATVNQPWTATVQTTHNLWDSGMIVEREGGNGGYDGWLGNDGGTLTFFMEGTYTVTLSGRDDNGESVEALLGGLPRVELFARRASPGWDVWGNEVESDIQL